MHSPYSSLKSYAANNIKLFIKEFEELQDDAINAVYDLCEDQDPRVRHTPLNLRVCLIIPLQVRKDGYRAITQVSREQKKWVKRNADVLVQLLQSGKSLLCYPMWRRAVGLKYNSVAIATSNSRTDTYKWPR